MLFLAVFCGFLAENKREHLVEHKRAKAYAQALLEDLKSDTAEINIAISQEALCNSMIDSLVIFISQSNPYDKSAKLYYYMTRAHRFYGVDWSRATMDQLINSGNLRYFTNDKLVTLISRYNTLRSVISIQENNILSHRSRAIAYRDQVFKAEVSLRSKFGKDASSVGSDSLFSDLLDNADWPVMSKDPELLNSYANALIATKPYRERLTTQYLPGAKEEATAIMELLKNEYHLE